MVNYEYGCLSACAQVDIARHLAPPLKYHRIVSHLNFIVNGRGGGGGGVQADTAVIDRLFLRCISIIRVFIYIARMRIPRFVIINFTIPAISNVSLTHIVLVHGWFTYIYIYIYVIYMSRGEVLTPILSCSQSQSYNANSIILCKLQFALICLGITSGGTNIIYYRLE